ncbi:hypothetical protein AAVH_31547, partial [Aphelenchoides avenae]
MKKRNPFNLSLPPTVNGVGGQEEPVENEPVLNDQLEKLALSQWQLELIPQWISQKQR